MKPWYEKTLLWGQVNLTEDDPEKCDLSFWKEYWKKSGVEGVIINCGGIVSYYPSGLPGFYQAEKLKGRDYFGVWNQAAREAGLVVIARMDINCTGEALYESRPEWYCRQADGSPVTERGRYVACVNGGYYKERIPAIFREVIGRYHPDGFADNSWAGPGLRTICYCATCRERFQEECGLPLPERVDWLDPIYRKWVRWSYQLRVENWKLFNAVTTDCGGADCRWFGMVNGNPFSTGGRFYDIRRLAQGAPFLFCDHQSREQGGGFWQNSVNGAMLRSAAGEGVVTAESMAHYYKGEKTFRLSCGERQEVRKWMLAGISGGLAPWFHFVGGGTEDRRKFQISLDLFRFMKENKESFMGRVNTAVVGLVWNQESAIYYGRDEAEGRVGAAFWGVAESLSRAGIPFLPIHADEIGVYGDRVKLLILPNVAILEENQERLLVDWLRKGKDLILTSDTGLFDQEGEWKGPGSLYLELGLVPERGTEGVFHSQEAGWAAEDTHTYLTVEEEGHPLFAGVPDTELLPFGGQVRKAVSVGALKPVSKLIPAFPVYPPEFSWIREGGSTAAIYAGELGSGSRVLYFAADVDRLFARWHVPDHRRLLEGAVRWAARGDFPVRVKAPAHIHVDAYRKDGQILIHLVNLAGARVPAGTLEENIPVGPVEVRLRGEQAAGKKAYCLVGGEACEVQQEQEEAVIRIPVLGEHELIQFG